MKNLQGMSFVEILVVVLIITIVSGAGNSLVRTPW